MEQPVAAGGLCTAEATKGKLHCTQLRSLPSSLIPSHNAGWRERSILLFRIMRKRALRQTIERIQAALQQQQQEGQGSGTAPVVAGGASTQAPPSQRVRPQQRAAAAEAGADAAGSGRDEL